MNISTSESLFTSAQQSIPGGVNSPVRAFKSVGGTPIFIQSARGAYLTDEDGNQYIDYINSWGPMILGHAYEPVVKAIRKKVLGSTSFGAPTRLETEMAELIKTMVPNVELVRMVNSGTEACMSAVRLARGFTGRSKIIKFDGCYHGHADCFLVKAGSGMATFEVQGITGITKGITKDTLIAPYNNLEKVAQLFNDNKKTIAALIIEPLAGNMGCILPEPGFLQGLRKLCDQDGVVLIFDEVMTGFRLAKGGAQEKYSVAADLVTYGKIIGGGLPVGAFGGKKEIMQQLSPLGNVYQAGTLSGNPLAMIAGYTLLKELNENPAIYLDLEQKGARLESKIHEALDTKSIAHQINRVGSMISLHFSDKKIIDFETASNSNIPLFNQFFHHMLGNGIYLPPSAFESWFLSNALNEEDLDKTINAIQSFSPKGAKAN